MSNDGLIALHQIRGVGWHTIHKLTSVGWTFENELSSIILDKLKGHKIPHTTIKNIREKWNQRFVSVVKQELIKRDIGVITILDEEYPSLLKEIAQPPWVIYYKGDKSLLAGPSLAIVGTRKPTLYGLKVTRTLGEQLSQVGWVIVSGMASGIDGAAHRSVLTVQGKTIAVLGCGVDVVYPKNHRSLYADLVSQALVISEVPPGTAPHPGLFPQRNRIISGLSYGTVVVEAAEKSGSLITADFSMEQGREVFAVPGPITSEKSGGAIRLIQQGAKCVSGIQDILEEVPRFFSDQAMVLKSTPEQLLTEQEKQLLQFIDMEPIQVSSLIEKASSRLSIGEIHQFLLSLETKGRISRLPGSSYILS